MPPAPKRSAGQAAIKMAASLAKMSQKPNTHAAEPAEEPLPKKTRFAPPASWLGNHEQNDDAEQNGKSEQNDELTAAWSPAETNQPAPAGAAESKPQEACNK